MSSSSYLTSKLDDEEKMLLWSEHKLPANINKQARALWLEQLTPSVRAVARQLVHDAGWRIFTVDQQRGRCMYRSRIITIPTWCIEKTIGANGRVAAAGYSTWYTAHELSHVFAPTDNHGPQFMRELIKLCPDEFICYELGYKPRNAAAAGIGNINLMDL